MEHFDELTPRDRGRITGVIYLAYFVLSILRAVFLQQAGISVLSPNGGSASAFASTVMANQAALQVGVALTLLSTALYVGVTTLFYQLFKHVGRTIALLGLAFGLTAMAITAFATLFDLAPVSILNSGGTASAALTCVKLGEQVTPISLLFSGFFQVFNGYLMFRSGFVPRILGALLALAGFGWFLFLIPPVSNLLLPGLEAFGFVAEVALMLWLLIRGIDSERWRVQAAAA
jgi:hypothetical protein